MAATPQKIHTSPDDIDLLLLIERIILFFKKYRWVYVIAIILGLFSGIIVYRYLQKIYTSTMIVHSSYLTNQEQIEITENWNELLGKSEYDELAVSFNCDKNILHRLKKIKAEEIQKVFTGVNPHGFSIKVNVTDNEILDELQKGFVYGFENCKYVKERLDFKKARVQALIDQITIEIEKLDSTKKIIGEIIAGKVKGSASLIIDAASANRQWIEMNEKLLAHKEDLRFSNAIQVLQGFSKFRRPAGPKLFPWLVIGLAFFLSLTSIYTVISSVRAKIRYRSMATNKTSDNDPAFPI